MRTACLRRLLRADLLATQAERRAVEFLRRGALCGGALRSRGVRFVCRGNRFCEPSHDRISPFRPEDFAAACRPAEAADPAVRRSADDFGRRGRALARRCAARTESERKPRGLGVPEPAPRVRGGAGPGGPFEPRSADGGAPGTSLPETAALGAARRCRARKRCGAGSRTRGPGWTRAPLGFRRSGLIQVQSPDAASAHGGGHGSWGVTGRVRWGQP